MMCTRTRIHDDPVGWPLGDALGPQPHKSLVDWAGIDHRAGNLRNFTLQTGLVHTFSLAKPLISKLDLSFADAESVPWPSLKCG